jgi:PAS domain S-box-containing protein
VNAKVVKESEQERIRDLLKNSPKGLTIEEVSKKLTLNRTTSAKYLNSMVAAGLADMRTLGPAKLFYLTQRLPLTNLLSLASDLIIIFDQDLIIQEVNEPFLSWFKCSKEDLKGLRIEHSPIAPYFSEDHLGALEQALEGKESISEISFDIDTDCRFFKMKFIPLVFEGGGRAVGIILEDISEMKRYQQELEERVRLRTAALVKTNDALQKEIEEHTRDEEALKRNEARLRRAEGVARFGNWEYHPDNDRVIASEGARALYGISGKEWNGEDTRKFVLPEFRPVLDAAMKALIEQNRPYDVEYKILRMDNGSVITLQSIAEYDPEKKVVFGVIHDITDRKRAEEGIRKATKQILLLNSVTRHDILNQLNSLVGYLGMTRAISDDEKIAALVIQEQQIAETIRRQITFTRDYQNIGMQPPQWNNVRTTLNRLLETTDLGSISVAVNTGNLEIYSDMLIEKVYSNLFDNTLRHGKNVSSINIDSHQNGDDLVIVYEDDGEGIPAEDKEQIFERGFGRNTGYGLFLVREILAITGLSIRETGTFGQGARFEIIVPKGLFRDLPAI